MFIPNQIARIANPLAPNLYGEKAYGQFRDIPCAVVKLVITAQDTSVRSDSSASRGTSEEMTTAAKLLFPATETIGIDDRVQLAGADMRVKAIHPRFDVHGRHDHNEVDLDRWGGS